MNTYEYIKSLTPDEMANLLYMVYNLGLNDADHLEDQSDFFSEQMILSDSEEFTDKIIPEFSEI